MRIERLKLTNYKNCSAVDLTLDPHVNIIHGPNGSGKTNLLDSIHYLAMSKSYFPLSDKHLVRHGEDFFRVEGFYEIDERKEHLAIKYGLGKRREIQINGSKISKVQELIGKYPVVMIAPDDIKIVKGASKDRRDYFNKWLCQSDPEYLDALMKYNRYFRQKDQLLKQPYSPNPLSVESYNHQMAPLAEQIHMRIKDTMKSYEPKMLEQYLKISNGQDEIGLSYVSDLEQGKVVEQFAEKLEEEIRYRRPLVGVQRDEYQLEIQNMPIRKYGSQGQIKSLLYALRLAEYSFLHDRLNRKPILLLDDYFEKLDKARLQSLISLVQDGTFGQVFLSDTELMRSKEIFDLRGINFASFEVNGGEVKQVMT